MTSINKRMSEKGTWVFIAPVRGIVLTKAINFEYTIDRVTLLEASKLPRIRKRLGFPYPISQFKKKYSSHSTHFFSQTNSFATMRFTGKGSEENDKFLNCVREELAILSLSQLGYGRRRLNAYPVLAEEKSAGSLNYLMMNTKTKSWVQHNETTGKFFNLSLDERWLKFQREGFFVPLLNILRGRTKITGNWKKDIRNATILMGQSQCSSDLPQSFLWNMIALETFLTQQGESYIKKLPERVEAFIGWTTNWKIENYEEKIRQVYKKRCDFVHAGKIEDIEIEDVLFSDVLLLNILLNIVRHPAIFNTKESLIKFSEKIRAEQVLGIRPKIRPRTMTFWNPRYQTQDYKKI